MLPAPAPVDAIGPAPAPAAAVFAPVSGLSAVGFSVGDGMGCYDIRNTTCSLNLFSIYQQDFLNPNREILQNNQNNRIIITD